MKILTLLYPAHFEQSLGGAELQIRYLIKYAKEAGHEIHYIYEDSGKPILNLDNLFLHPLSRIKTIKGFGKNWFMYKNEIIKVLTKISPDVIYTRLGSSWAGIASIYARGNGIRHIHALASDRDVDTVISLDNLIHPFSFIDKLYFIRGLKYATEIIAQNNYQESKLQKFFDRRATNIAQMTPIVQENHFIKEDKPVKILWVGNLKKTKRPELFIQLAEKMHEKGINGQMIMVGRSSKEYISLLHKSDKIPNFEYLGELDQNQVFNLMLGSHILVNTSSYEGFSNTFVQAWMRKMVVISMNSNPNEILTKENIGFICSDIKTLLEKIEILVTDPVLMKAMADKAYHYSVENHSLEKNISLIISLIN